MGDAAPRYGYCHPHLGFVHCTKYATSMASRIGRPRIGIKPNFITRVDPTIAASARQAARSTGKRVGVWLEEAIQEKIEREKGDHNVTKTDS